LTEESQVLFIRLTLLSLLFAAMLCYAMLMQSPRSPRYHR